MVHRKPTISRQSLPGALLACGLCLGLVVPATSGELPTAEEVFAKHTEAIGGDTLDELRNLVTEFTYVMPAMGLSTTGQAYVAFPDKSYSMIDLMAMGSGDVEEGVNGGVAWQNNPQTGLRLLEGIEKKMALQRTRLDPFARWGDLWEKAETVGEETLGERACYKVVLTASDGDTIAVYFDKETGLLLQQEVPVPQLGSTVVVKLSDHREVDGVTLAHRIDQEGPFASTIEFTSVLYNVDDIPADTFELPQRVKEMAGQ
jgi:hypothetical protein